MSDEKISVSFFVGFLIGALLVFFLFLLGGHKLGKSEAESVSGTQPADIRSVHACMLYGYDEKGGVWNRILTEDGKPMIPQSVSMLSCYDPSIVQDMMMWRIQVDGVLQAVDRKFREIGGGSK